MTDTIQQFSSLDQALHSLFGNNVKITDRKQVAGGDINEAYQHTRTPQVWSLLFVCL